MFRVSTSWRVLTPRQALHLLSLSPTSDLTPAAVKKAYIRHTLRCHPDLNPNDPNANDNFRNLSDAFRVALKALEMQRDGAAGLLRGRNGGSGDAADLYDPQAALESLRRAIAAYRTHQRHDDTSSSAPNSSSPPNDPVHSVFHTPSLEDVSSVCKREAIAMRRVHTFCAELPVVLCGSQSAALFEAVAFFHARYVESMSACVMRFAQNLPILVRRVVTNRRKYVRNNYSNVTRGIGTGVRPHGQRLEDMAMKPLVLMGALIFDLPENTSAAFERVADDAKGEEFVTGRGSTSSSTCGVSQPSDISVTSELKCSIYPTDSIGDITIKLGKWEAASFERLKVELAIVDVTRLLSGMLGLQDEEAPARSESHLAMRPHLAETREATEMVLRTLQKLATDLCFHFDPTVDAAVTNSVIGAMRLHESWDASPSLQDDAAAVSLPLPTLVAHCRRLAELARPTIRGNTTLTWNADDADELVKDAAELAQGTPSESSAPSSDKSHPRWKREEKSRSGSSAKLLVGRHLTCSTAETLLFSVSVVLTKDLREFLLRLRGALKRVVQATNLSKHVLFELLPVREAIVKEEYIPIPASAKDGGDPDAAAAVSPFRYRGPIHCFPRVCNMDTQREHQLWTHLHAHREYIAMHAPAMNPLNVFYECLPYDPDAPEYRPPSPETGAMETLAGWVSGGADGCDNVVITAAELDDAAQFKGWLEDVVEQSSLNREAEETLTKAGVGYVSRDPVLPLANFLSFAKLFVQSSAVRGVLEKRGGEGTMPLHGTATSDDVGLSIIVSPARCDVRDGGRLFIPWYVDPSILLALLAETTAHRQLGTP